ncbi:MAG: T9SS type A sorting domain-containing protein [Saprospiraceae bacterium]
MGKSTEDIPGWDEYHGFGRINAFKALSVGVSSTTTPILNSTLRITPNPANGSFRVTRQTALSGMCSLYDGQGKLVFQTKLDQQTTFDLQTNLPNGLYWMRIKTAETLEMGRVMIQR